MNNTKTKKTLAPLLYFIKPYPAHIIVLVFLILISSVLEGANILAIFGLLNMVFSPVSYASGASSGKLAYFTIKIINIFPFQNKLLSVIIIVILLIFVKCLFDFLRRYFTSYVSSEIWHDVQYNVFKKCLHANYQFFLDNKEGEIMYRCLNAPCVMGITLQYSCEFLAEIIKLLVILFVLFIISFKFSIAIIFFTGLFYLFTNFIAKKVSYHLGKGRQDSSVMQTVILTELINGIKQIKIFLSEKRWLKEYDNTMRHYFGLYVKDEAWQALPPNILELLAVILLGILFLSTSKASQTGMPAGQLPALGAYVYSFYKFMPSLKNLSAKRMSYVGNFAIIETLYNFCNQDISIIPDGDTPLIDFKDAIRFVNVDFRYPGRGATVNNVNFEIKEGKTTAIVGKSGSGKTTIVNLILRLFVPKSGEILVDGIKLKDLKLDTWLKRIGYVSQETFIFNASLRENIIFGRPADEDRLIEVSKLANAHDFIMDLPDKYETLVGDRGMKLSGGQRQRIAIARAMYSNPQFLIFDEATTSLDNLSEIMIQNALKKISVNRTVILIAHRLSTVINSDKIIVLDNGRIVEEGTHEELINMGGAYWRLYDKKGLTENISK